MNTSQYDKRTRKALKRAQRTTAYANLQADTKIARLALETVLHDRNNEIARLKKALGLVRAAGLKHPNVDYAALGAIDPDQAKS